jgi:hypothetical protein
MKHCRVVAMALLLLGAAVGRSYALVGIYVGGFGGISSQKLSFSDVKFDTDTTFLYGLRLGAQVAMFALELNYYRAGHNIAMADFFLFNWDGMENDTSFLGANLRVMFPLAAVRPFLALGYGYYTADVKSIDKDTEGGFNIGAGLEVKLGKLAIIGEGKYNRVTLKLSDLDVGLRHFTFSVGLNYYF